LLERRLKHHHVQIIELGPGQLAVLHAVHVRAIDRPPGIGEGGPVDLQPLGFAELLALGDHAGTPIDHGAEDVEGEHLKRAILPIVHFSP
jgi:hypothetical protein